MLIDCHCHINSLSRQAREDLFAKDLSDYRFIDSSIDLETTYNSLTFSQYYPHVMTAVGLHPFSGANYTKDVLKEYTQILQDNKKIIAIGEIGLDHKAPIPLSKQEEIFRDFVGLAYRNNLPIIIHNRFDQKVLFEDGVPYIITLLDEMIRSYENVMFHCFSYSRKFLDIIVDKGGYVSFSLNVLREHPRVMDSLKHCPLNNILFETDSPYMKIGDSPSTPLDIGKVYDLAASVRGVDVKILENAASINAKKLFKLP
jgi:TatD DNase family protein